MWEKKAFQQMAESKRTAVPAKRRDEQPQQPTTTHAAGGPMMRSGSGFFVSYQWVLRDEPPRDRGCEADHDPDGRGRVRRDGCA